MSIYDLNSKDDINKSINGCKDGDTIVFAPGIYPPLNLKDKEITLQGKNPWEKKIVEQTIIKGIGKPAISLKDGEEKQFLIYGVTLTSDREALCNYYKGSSVVYNGLIN